MALFRALLREFHGSRSRVIFFTLCLALGVAAIVGVSSLVAIIERGLASESRNLLAGDVRVSARRPLPEQVEAFFEKVQHERTDLVELGAMISVAASDVREAGSRLVELKVVDETYPMYGELALEPQGVDASALGANSAFIGPELAIEFGLGVDDKVSVGGATFQVAAIVVDEPDRLEFAMTLGPRVFLGTEGLARTSLMGEKSRVRYISLYKFEQERSTEQLAELEASLRTALGKTPYVNVRTHTNAQPNVTRSLGRGRRLSRTCRVAIAAFRRNRRCSNCARVAGGQDARCGSDALPGLSLA